MSLVEGERGIEVAEERMLRVFLAQDGIGNVQSPVDTQRHIENRNTAVSLRMIVIIALVLEHRHIRKHRKTVGKPLWNEKLPMVLLRQFHGHMLPVGRRTLADVHRHIKHSPDNNKLRVLFIYLKDICGIS